MQAPAGVSREFFARDATELAPSLLGAVLRHTTAEGTVAVRITEVEAYRGNGEDPGSHAHRGVTPRTRVMFGPPAHLYAYLSYGMHVCANIVCGAEGSAGGLLLRGGEIVDGIALARAHRRKSARQPSIERRAIDSCIRLVLVCDRRVDSAPAVGVQLTALGPPVAMQQVGRDPV